MAVRADRVAVRRRRRTAGTPSYDLEIRRNLTRQGHIRGEQTLAAALV